MLDNAQSRSKAASLIEPPARYLLRMGVTPDAITWSGTLLLIGVAGFVIAPGHVVLGGLLFIVISATDLLDGTMARLRGSSSAWGAFLDSSLDRVADGATMLGIIWVLTHSRADSLGAAAAGLALVGGQLTSYVRARAEAVGADCKLGLAERGERNILMTAGLVLSGIDPRALPWAMVVLAVATWVTVAQRMRHVHRQLNP